MLKYFIAAFLVVLFFIFVDYYMTEQVKRRTRVSRVCGGSAANPEDFFPRERVFSRAVSTIVARIGRSDSFVNMLSADGVKKGYIPEDEALRRRFVATKIVLSGIGLFLGYVLALLGGYPWWAALAGLVIGFYSFDIFSEQRHKRHLRLVDAGIADSLDLFLVCAEAGLGMETAMERVAAEMVTLNKDIAYEFQVTVDELKVTSDRQKTLSDMGRRTGVEGMVRLSNALAQTVETGASLGNVLRVLVAEIREDVLIRYEAKAARLSVLLTFPMIVFLLPCMFIVIAGPAIINIMGALSN